MEFREGAVRIVPETGKSVPEVARALGIVSRRCGTGSIRTRTWHCVTNIQPGRDRNTGLSMVFSGSHAGYAHFELHSDGQCTNEGFLGIVTRQASSSIPTKNWWVSLKG